MIRARPREVQFIGGSASAVGQLPADVVFAGRVPATWDLIGPTVEFVRLMAAARANEKLGQRIGLVLHELLENAVKYGGLGEDLLVEVRHRAFTGFEVRVTNRAVPSRFSILETEMARLQAMTPDEAFADALKRSTGLARGVSMIGLSRIAHEGRVTLETQAEGKRVTVIARGKQ